MLLAAGLIACIVAVFLTAPSQSQTSDATLGSASNGIILLDLSASVERGTFAGMYSALSRFSATNGHFGLVVFSSRAYEALAPDTPASDLAPIARFFKPLSLGNEAARRAAAYVGPSYPTNPWTTAFSFGTTISSALELARRMVVAARLSHPTVWLVSDLADTPTDWPYVTTAARSYAGLGIRLNLIGLNPSPADQAFFDNLHLRGNSTQVRPLPVSAHPRRTAGFPLGLAIGAAALAVLLAANELWAAPLRWVNTRTPPTSRASTT